jgi:hypothetical protein
LKQQDQTLYFGSNNKKRSLERDFPVIIQQNGWLTEISLIFVGATVSGRMQGGELAEF